MTTEQKLKLMNQAVNMASILADVLPVARDQAGLYSATAASCKENPGLYQRVAAERDRWVTISHNIEQLFRQLGFDVVPDAEPEPVTNVVPFARHKGGYR